MLTELLYIKCFDSMNRLLIFKQLESTANYVNSMNLFQIDCKRCHKLLAYELYEKLKSQICKPVKLYSRICKVIVT